jgi:hypothetical protein
LLEILNLKEINRKAAQVGKPKKPQYSLNHNTY